MKGPSRTINIVELYFRYKEFMLYLTGRFILEKKRIVSFKNRSQYVLG